MGEKIEKNQSKSIGTLIKNYTKEHIFDIVSIMGLVLCLVVFTVGASMKGTSLWSKYNRSVLIETICTYMIISLGGVFVYSMGYMDVSVGQQLGVYSILVIMMTNATGSILLSFVVVLVLALLCGAFNGYVAVWLKLPSIVTSLFLMFVLGGVQYLLIEGTGNNQVTINYDFKLLDEKWFMLLTMFVIGAIVFYVLNYTKLGKYTKSIGENELTAQHCGINTTFWKVIAYMSFGVCVAIGSVFLLARTGSAGKGTGGGYAMDVMLCLILGGMPLSGGFRAKVRCAVVGTITYVLLSNGMTLMQVPTQYIYFVKAVIFLVIVALSCRSKNRYLPR